MDNIKSMGELPFEAELITALLCDLHKSHGHVFNARSLRNTCNKVIKRVTREGISFLTKGLPRLGKAFDKALTNKTPLNGPDLGFKAQPESNLPLFMGEFFNRVLSPTGTVLPDPCAESVAAIRQVLYWFYKYELPYDDRQEQQVISRFVQTEDELKANASHLHDLQVATAKSYTLRREDPSIDPAVRVVREARIRLSQLFSRWNPREIVPRHGPGAVATRQKLWDKYHWTNVADRITEQWPLDEFFYASVGHVCDTYGDMSNITGNESSARVVLVPKDSRGPRLISCEPVDFQWIQQGLMTSIVRLVETHRLTKHNVFFTNQQPNQFGALLGSRNGKYVTLDLNEASDRVSVDLVRLLFPDHATKALLGARSLSTVLPDQTEIILHKFAPMGSAICFPVLALTIWSLLSSAATDADTRESILVYGDDVIVPTAFAGEAIKTLEAFGLKVNADKSCTSGPFRESCGMDAFSGIPVTPVRSRTVWSSRPSADVYTSWIATANSMWDRCYYSTYDKIVSRLHAIYGAIPAKDMNLSCPALEYVDEENRPNRKKWSKRYQKRLWQVLDVVPLPITDPSEGWHCLLRYFTEAGRANTTPPPHKDSTGVRRVHLYDGWMATGEENGNLDCLVEAPFSVRKYTPRDRSMLRYVWR